MCIRDSSSGAGEPLLMLAIRKNANNVIDLLLKQKNIKVDQPNTLKETPLMIAIFLKDNDVAKKLIAHGAAVKDVYKRQVIVDGNTANIHSDFFGCNGFKGLHATRERIVNF